MPDTLVIETKPETKADTIITSLEEQLVDITDEQGNIVKVKVKDLTKSYKTDRFLTQKSQKLSKQIERANLLTQELEAGKPVTTDDDEKKEDEDEGNDEDEIDNEKQTAKKTRIDKKIGKKLSLDEVKAKQEQMWNKDYLQFITKHPDLLTQGLNETEMKEMYRLNPSLEIEDIYALTYGKETIAKQQSVMGGTGSGGNTPATSTSGTSKPKHLFEMTISERAEAVEKSAKEKGLLI